MRVVIGDDGYLEGAIVLAVLEAVDHGLRGQAVADRVAPRAALAFLGPRPGALLRVLPVRGPLPERSHGPFGATSSAGGALSAGSISAPPLGCIAVASALPRRLSVLRMWCGSTGLRPHRRHGWCALSWNRRGAPNGSALLSTRRRGSAGGPRSRGPSHAGR
jgi:hypothetical protein